MHSVENITLKQHNCYIVLMQLGYYCGYAEVPKDIRTDEIICHGGITYNENQLMGLEAKKGFKWIGFDCIHLFDGICYEIAKLHNPEIVARAMARVYKDEFKRRPFIIGQLNNIIDQVRRAT